MINHGQRKVCWFIACMLLIYFVIGTTNATAGDGFKITDTRWDLKKELLEVKGKGVRGRTVTITGTGFTMPLGTTTIIGDDWKVRVYNLISVPCKVTATQSDGRTDERLVNKAPEDCLDGEDMNSPPTANANGPYSGFTGSAVNFSSAGSTDPDGSIVSYKWDFGDGSRPSNLPNPSHTYTSAGTYTVTLTVTDNEGASDSDSTAANISAPDVNIPPTANANGPYTGFTGSAVNFSSAGSTDPDGSIVSYEWDFGDGSRPSNLPNPSHTYISAGTYTVTLTVTDNEGASDSDSTAANISAPDVNIPPTANANGPYTGFTGSAVNFSSAGSTDPDGSIVSYEWDFGDGNFDTQANPSHTYISAGTYTVTLTVTDGAGDTGTDTTTAAITDQPVACTSPIQEHCSITSYTGPEVCVACHKSESVDMHGSVHYQQGGAFPDVTNIPMDFASAGKQPAQAAGDLVATGMNTYCGTVENSPRFTCAGCHVGNGRFPMAQSDFELLPPDSVEAHKQLANIDCLTCHQEVYKRFPDWINGEGFSPLVLLNLLEDTDGSLIRSDGDEVIRLGFSGIPNVDPVTLDFQFLPAGSDTLPPEVPMAPMSLTTLAAAQNVHLTTRQSCLNCHATSGGADGTKRGDMAKENADPSISLDMHMSPDGQNLDCADCHDAIGDSGEGHRMRGRGLDLRPSDISERFTCENSGCHSALPHGDFSTTIGSSKDKHASRVACQTCHITAYAKASVGTETARDWQDPHPTATACNGRGGWLPREDKGGLGTEQIIPDYTWFDGTSEIYYLGESLNGVPTVPLDADVAASFAGDFNSGDPAVVLGVPNGDVTSSGAKIYPMKTHWGMLARNDQDDTLVGHSTFEFFRTGSFCRAVAVGLGIDEVNAPASNACIGTPGDLEMPPGTTAVPVFSYQTINHGVETTDNALGNATNCGSCHSTLLGGPVRMDMDALGYGPRLLPSVVIDTNVTILNGDLDNICSQCHSNKTNTKDREFVEVHKRHVEKEGRECSACHDLSRPERGLSLTRK